MNHNQAAAELTTAAGWRKSSYSQGANGCVEVTTELPGWVGVRDTTLGTDNPVLSFTRRMARDAGRRASRRVRRLTTSATPSLPATVHRISPAEKN
ncbi:MAG: DUF397 domain-containing protein [Pseudonocardiaceae bacterium]